MLKKLEKDWNFKDRTVCLRRLDYARRYSTLTFGATYSRRATLFSNACTSSTFFFYRKVLAASGITNREYFASFLGK